MTTLSIPDLEYGQLTTVLDIFCFAVDRVILASGIPLHDRKAVEDAYQQIFEAIHDEVQSRPIPARTRIQ